MEILAPFVTPSQMGTPLYGLKAIGGFLRCHPQTARRYIAEMGLPAAQLPRRCGQIVWVTTPLMINNWILAQDRVRRAMDDRITGPFEMQPCVIDVRNNGEGAGT